MDGRKGQGGSVKWKEIFAGFAKLSVLRVQSLYS